MILQSRRNQNSEFVSLSSQMLFVWIFDIMQIPALFRPWLKSDNHEYADIIISHEYY